MDCRQCAENLTAYLDGELNPAEEAEVRHHLQACRLCTAEMQSLHKADQYIESQIRDIAPKPETWRIVQARISAAQEPRAKFRFYSLRWHLAATMTVMLGIFGFGYMQYRQFEKRSLDSYTTKYARERDSRIRIKAVLTASGSGEGFETAYGGNPFIEVSFTPEDNPFLLEDR
jgi:predicted anti-sigma-YlaC factor YlaD